MQAENGSLIELRSQRYLELSKKLEFEEEKSWQRQNHRAGSPEIHIQLHLKAEMIPGCA